MAYGQHQSFYLRDRWLSKGLRHISEDERFFYDKEAFEKIGLGKNMVQSLRFWVIATGVVEEKFNDDRKKAYHPSELGKVIYEYDRFVQFNDTAAIIHYHLSREKEPATIWYWFFNILNETIIPKEEVTNSFIVWVKQEDSKIVSERSLRRDVDCLLKLYTAGQSHNDPEEVIQSPITKLNLVQEKKGIVYKVNPTLEDIGLTALMYSLLDYSRRKDIYTITVEEIVSNEGMWGKVFNTTRGMIINALEKLSLHPEYNLTFTRTNNLDTVRLPKITPLEFLRSDYSERWRSLYDS